MDKSGIRRKWLCFKGLICFNSEVDLVLEIRLGLKASTSLHLHPPNTKFMLFQLGAVFSHGLTKNCYFWPLAL